MVDRAEAVRLFEKRRDAFLAEDLEAYVSLFAEDMLLQTPTSEVRGRAAYREMVRRAYDAMRPVSFEFHEIAVHESRVLAEWTITLAVRADDSERAYRGMSICELDDGLIRWWREFYDPALLRSA
jgi:uncharacterized protein (TIGR02246 family)